MKPTNQTPNQELDELRPTLDEILDEPKTTTQLINEAVERFNREFVKNGRLRHDKYLQESPTDIIDFIRQELQSLEKTVREDERKRLAKEVEEMDQNLIGTMDSIAGYEKALKDVLAKLDTKND